MSDQAHENTKQQRGRTYPPGYGVVEPVANYRPWDIDGAFTDVYEIVREHTMVDVYRLWTLWFIASQIPAGDVLEIGSWRGGSGTVIARSVAREADAAGARRGAPPRTVFLADTFSGVVKATARDSYYKGGEHANTSPDLVRELLDRAGLPGVRLLVGVFPDDSGEEIADRRFALCHIDVDVYQSAKECFEWVWPRMVPGGVVVFDDYGFYGCEGVTAYVNELAAGEGEAAAGGDTPAGKTVGGAGLTGEGQTAGRPTVVPSLSGQAIITRTVY
ncbi:MAG: TylF/MycF/NovP-related O-methyltransferase [Spirochaetota bacterium]